MSQLQRVNKEQAIKLKELGFNWLCRSLYYKNSDDIYYHYSGNGNWNDKDIIDMFSAPELDLACKYLREIKNIHVEATYALFDENNLGYIPFQFVVLDISDRTKWCPICVYEGVFEQYESAQSAGLDVALEYLI